ncbi:MAG: tetratricopeptide repeat protein [Proteobacteria bacterium]|nr:tetratricopeptide repeat protein [Pseudomonadota bacterium]
MIRGHAFAIFGFAASMVVVATPSVALAQGSPGQPADERNADESSGEDVLVEEGNAAREAQRRAREAKRRARDLYKKGKTLVRAKDFDQGIAAIEAAYELDPRVEHLYNLGAAHHLKGDKRRALEYYQRVIVDSTSGQLVRLARRFAGQLEREIAAEEASRAAFEAREEAAERAVELDRARRKAIEEARAARRELRRVRADLQASREQTTRLQSRRDRWRAIARSRGGRGKRFIGSVLMVTGGSALGMAGAYALVARKADSELEDLDEGASQAGLREISDQADERFLVLSIAGGSMFIAGAVLYILGERDATRSPELSESALTITPTLGSGAAGISISGRF